MPKKGLEKRIIVDLSFPLGRTVNAGILRGHYQGVQCTFTLPNILDLAKQIVSTGQNSYIRTVDLSRADRQLRTCPLSVPLIGSWKRYLLWHTSFWLSYVRFSMCIDDFSILNEIGRTVYTMLS